MVTVRVAALERLNRIDPLEVFTVFDGQIVREGDLVASVKVAPHVVPEATIFSEHPVVIIDRNISAFDRPVIDAFVQYLWTEEAQRAFVHSNFRSSTNDALNRENSELATIKYPFTVAYFGGWEKAYPDIIEGIFRDQVQKRK